MILRKSDQKEMQEIVADNVTKLQSYQKTMEEIVGRLLVADNATILQATKELKEAFKNPEAIPALSQLIVSSANPQIRQSAAVLIRKKLSKRSAWNKVPENIRNGIKQGMIQAVVNEQEKLVRNAIVQFIGIIGKHEFPNNTWPELLQFVNTLCTSETTQDKELGMYTLSIMTEMCVDQYITHAESFSYLFTNILSNLQDYSSPLAYYTIITMKNFVSVIGGHQQMINVYHNLMPRIIDCIKAFTVTDKTKACDVMDILDELVEFAINVIIPHSSTLVELCLQLAMTRGIDDTVKVKAINFVGWLTRTKSKNIQKNKLVEPIVNVLFGLLRIKPENEGEEEYFTDDPDDTSPMTCATQTLDILALHIPPEKMIPPLLVHIEPALQGNDIYAKKAAYVTIAILAEGCCECVRTKYLQPFLQCICKGIADPNPVVRNAALFALGQFSEHLQPEISKYASDLLPVLFDFLSQMCIQLQNNGKEPGSIDRMFYALELFCENLDHGLLPYLPTLMERLFFTLNPNHSIHLRELTLSAIAAAANAAKEEIMPYFERIIQCLDEYLVADEASEMACLQSQAVDTLGIIARAVGAEHFKPLAQKSLQLALNLVTNTDDPDIRKSAYGLFASLASVMKEDIASVLPQIIEQMIETIRSSDGIVTRYTGEEASGLYDDLSEEDEEEDIEDESSESDDDDAAAYAVENAYVEEKEEACTALKEIAEFAGAAFLPYLENCFEEVFKLFNYPQEDIRKAAVSALLQFCITLSKINAIEGRQALLKALQVFVPKCSELIRTDDERLVVISALDAYAELLKEIGRDVLVGEGHQEAIMNCVVDVMTSKTSCQDQDQEEDNDDPEAEQDEMLWEYAGEIIPHFGMATSPEEFAMYFPNMLALLQVRAKKQCSTSQRSFAMGTISECMEPLGTHVVKFTGQLMPLLLHGSRDTVNEVRNNAIFAIGEMVMHGKEHIYPFYEKILQMLSEAISKDKNALVLDNICGALAKMITVNINGVPIDQVFPVFVQHLPLREDFEEYESVFKCICNMYQIGHPQVVKHLPDIIRIAAGVIHEKQSPNTETKMLIIHLLKSVQSDFANEFNNIVQALPPEVSQSLQASFQA